MYGRNISHAVTTCVLIRATGSVNTLDINSQYYLYLESAFANELVWITAVWKMFNAWIALFVPINVLSL